MATSKRDALRNKNKQNMESELKSQSKEENVVDELLQQHETAVEVKRNDDNKAISAFIEHQLGLYKKQTSENEEFIRQTYYLTLLQVAMIDKYSEDNDISKSDLIRKWISAGIKKDCPDVGQGDLERAMSKVLKHSQVRSEKRQKTKEVTEAKRAVNFLNQLKTES